MRLRYAFPEPLPLDRARGVQTVNTVAALGRAGVDVDFAFVPGSGDPFEHYDVARPTNMVLAPISRSWFFPWVRSNRLFAWRLARRWGTFPESSPVMVRHLKLAAWIARHRPSWPLVYEAHEVFADTAPREKASAREREEQLVMRRARAVVANSNATAARLEHLYGKANLMEAVPNGADVPETPPAKDWTHARRHIVYAGSLFPWKGVDDLAYAAARLPGFRITMIGGTASQCERLRNLAGQAGAEVVLPGRLPHRTVLSSIASACIAVLPNRLDTESRFSSPVKLFEYLGRGCAIVATDVPAFREVLGESDAVWARPGDPVDLARAIGSLAGDVTRARMLGERSRAIAGRYTWDARAKRLIEVFRRGGLLEDVS